MSKPAVSRTWFLLVLPISTPEAVGVQGSKGQPDGWVGVKGYHPASNTWIWPNTYCSYPEVSVSALGMASLAISMEGTLPYCALKDF